MTIYDRLEELGFSQYAGKYVKRLTGHGMIINGVPQPVQYMLEIETLPGSYEVLKNGEHKPMESIYVRVYQKDKLMDESSYLIDKYDVQWFNHILSNL